MGYSKNNYIQLPDRSWSMIILIITRLLDIFTTYLNINKWGIEVEGNPIVRKIMEHGLFLPYQLCFIGIVILIAEHLPKYKRIIYISISCISLLAVVNNLFCFIFIK
jgi:hypothetical protein